MFFPKVLLNLHNKTILLQGLPFKKNIVSYKYSQFKCGLEKLLQLSYMPWRTPLRK
jgi:hypothetical protein